MATNFVVSIKVLCLRKQLSLISTLQQAFWFYVSLYKLLYELHMHYLKYSTRDLSGSFFLSLLYLILREWNVNGCWWKVGKWIRKSSKSVSYWSMLAIWLVNADALSYIMYVDWDMEWHNKTWPSDHNAPTVTILF